MILNAFFHLPMDLSLFGRPVKETVSDSKKNNKSVLVVTMGGRGAREYSVQWG